MGILVTGDFSLLFNRNSYGIAGTSYNGYSTGTIEIWIKNSGIVNDLQIIYGVRPRFILMLSSGNRLATYDYGTNQNRESNIYITDGNWHHIALTFELGTSNNKIYYDGVPVLSGFPMSAGTAALTHLIVGRLSDITSAGFQGFCDNARIWNTVRSDAEILESYNRFISPSSTGLTGYWLFNEGTGTTSVNQVSGGDSFTFVNSPVWSTGSRISSANLTFKYDFDSIQGVNFANTASGLPVYDASGVNGATITTDSKLGTGSLSLAKASSQYVQMPSFTNTTNGMTFCFWFKHNTIDTYARVFDFGNGTANYNIGYCPVFGAFFHTTTSTPVLNGGPSLIKNPTANVWHFFAWTIPYSTGSTTHTFYFNGSTATATTSSYPAIIQRSSNFIGRSNWSNDPYINLQVDDFRYYDRVLTPVEIDLIYNHMSSIYLIASPANAYVNYGQTPVTGKLSSSASWIPSQTSMPTSISGLTPTALTNLAYTGVYKDGV